MKTTSRTAFSICVYLCASVVPLHFPAVAVADENHTQVSFLLDGYYRPGRYLPVKIVGGSGTVTIRGEDGTSTIVTLNGSGQCVAPWLAERNPRSVRWSATDGTEGTVVGRLQSPAAGEKLLGLAVEDETVGKLLFGAETVIPIHLDAANPLPGPAEAWEALDAVALGESAAASLDSLTRQTLWAAGTTLAIRGSPKPDTLLPWQRRGDYWVAAGAPRPALLPKAAYEPAVGWQPGRSAEFRWKIVFGAVIFAIAALFIALSRWRWGVAAMAVAALAAVALGWFWQRGQEPVATAVGSVQRVGVGGGVIDRWIYLASPRDFQFELGWSGLARPIFFDATAAQNARWTLLCDGLGRPIKTRIDLQRDRMLAVVERSVDFTPPPTTQPAGGSRLDNWKFLATYPDTTVVGQVPSDQSDAGDQVAQWGRLVLSGK